MLTLSRSETIRVFETGGFHLTEVLAFFYLALSPLAFRVKLSFEKFLQKFFRKQ